MTLSEISALLIYASGLPRQYPVAITAGDLLAILNAIRQEASRADQAEAQLAARLGPPPGASN